MKRILLATVLAMSIFSLNSNAQGKESVIAGSDRQSKKDLSIRKDRLIMKAQEDASEYSYGMDPVRDSLAIEAIRAKMDSIRQTRPTVALVLAGGGARGITHVGVIKLLEELDMPIDIVLGTSMGGLVGGFYSLGYSHQELEKIVKNIDWDYALSDEIPDDYLTYADKDYYSKFAYPISFYYTKKYDETAKYKEKDEQLFGDRIHAQSIGNDDDTYTSEEVMKALPSGFNFGLNVNNILSSVTVGYQEDMPFWELPTPYVCVATDMVTCQPKIWYSGNINTAMRSTMSIPGLFTPIRLHNMVLVDGFIRDNYPVDIAKNLGVDYIIGVDLNRGYIDYEGMKNLGDLMSQMLSMLGRTSYELNKGIADVTIKPNTGTYGMLSFHKEAIDSMMTIGYEAALEKKDELLALKEKLGPNATKSKVEHKAINLNDKKVEISGIDIYGVTAAESRYLQRKAGLKPFSKVGAAELVDAESKIFATNAFDVVTYKLIGDKEPYRVSYNCVRGPVSEFGFGIRLDTEEVISLIFNAGFNINALTGHAVEVTGKISSSPYLTLDYYYRTEKGFTFNASTTFHRVSNAHYRVLDYDATGIMTCNHWSQEFYISQLQLKQVDFNLGVRNDAYWGQLNFNADNEFTFLPHYNMANNDIISAFFRGTVNTFDNWYYPTTGTKIDFNATWAMAGLQRKMDDYFILSLGAKKVFPIKEKFAVIPSVDFRSLVGSDSVSVFHANLIGGRMPSRYAEQQIPFMGVPGVVVMPKSVGVIGLDIRYNPATNHYISWISDFATASDVIDFSDKNASKMKFFGTGLEYAYNTKFGPARFDVYWSSITKKVGFYVGIGFDF